MNYSLGIFGFYLIFLSNISLADPSINSVDVISEPDFSAFVDRVRLPGIKISGQREMVPERYIELTVILKSKPVDKSYELINFLLKGMAAKPLNIHHSVFIGAANGPVLNAYAAEAAAQQLEGLDLNSPVQIQALHVYNFERGPRLVILSASAAGEG